MNGHGYGNGYSYGHGYGYGYGSCLNLLQRYNMAHHDDTN
jgi:hypothetical protein